MSNLSLNVKDYRKLIEAVKNLPPELWLFTCVTLDQVKHWHTVKNIFQQCSLNLQAFFSGSEPKLIVEECYKEIHILWSKKYIHFYELIFYAFAELKKQANEVDQKIPSTPGEYFSECVREDARFIFFQCQRAFEFRPKKFNKFHRDTAKYNLLKSKEKLTGGERQKILNYENASYDFYTEAKDYTPLTIFALSVTSESREAETRDSYNRYKATCSKLNHLLYGKGCHPSQKKKAYTWVGGEKKFFTRS